MWEAHSVRRSSPSPFPPHADPPVVVREEGWGTPLAAPTHLFIDTTPAMIDRIHDNTHGAVPLYFPEFR
jgi:hypothetical protein